MGLVRTAKSLSVRLDNRYITRPNRGRLFRKLLIAICSFAVLVGWGVYAGRGDKTPYSPGPLTSAHGMWDGNNCAWCHETKPEGGFVLTVSNAACMTCHDGSVHHPNSKLKFVDAVTGGPARDAGNARRATSSTAGTSGWSPGPTTPAPSAMPTWTRRPPRRPSGRRTSVSSRWSRRSLRKNTRSSAGA